MKEKRIIELALDGNGKIIYVSGKKYPEPSTYHSLNKEVSDYSLCNFGQGWIWVQEKSVKEALEKMNELPQNIVYENTHTVGLPEPQRKALCAFSYDEDGDLVKVTYPISEKVKVSHKDAIKIFGKVTLIEFEGEKYFVSEVSRLINEAFKSSPESMWIVALKADV